MGRTAWPEGLTNVRRNEFEMLSGAAPYGGNFIPQNSLPQQESTLPSSLQRKFMEFAGISEGNNIPSHLRNGGSHNFDMEVEQFLSNLGQEIRKNREKLVDGLDEGGMPSLGAAGFRSGGGSNYGMAGTGESASTGMRMGESLGMRAEMLKQMMMGNANTTGGIRRSTSGGAGGGGGGDNSSPGAMAEMIMMRNKITAAAAAAGNNFGMSMPGPPFYGSESPRQRGAVGGGGGGHEGRRRGDDDPALPEYGWGNGPR
jgi:hypothetical protein